MKLTAVQAIPKVYALPREDKDDKLGVLIKIGEVEIFITEVQLGIIIGECIIQGYINFHE